MPLSSIVIVVLRLFALNWLVQGIIAVTSTAASTRSAVFGADYMLLLPSAAMVVMAILLFMWSRVIAQMVTPKPPVEVQLGGLTSYDLYCFAFTFLGLYFVLTSLAGVLNWLHYVAVTSRDAAENDGETRRAFYGFTDQLITFLAGGASLLFAPRFARKLAAVQGREIKGG